MTTYIPLTLPGGYKLPIGVAVKRCIFYEAEQTPLSAESAKQLLRDAAAETVQRSMIAGSIQNITDRDADSEGTYGLELDFECREMIGRPADVGIFKDE